MGLRTMPKQPPLQRRHTWQPFAASAQFTLSKGDISPALNARLRDQVGNVSVAVLASIALQSARRNPRLKPAHCSPRRTAGHSHMTTT